MGWAWHVKVGLCAGMLGILVVFAVMTAWVYLERDHEKERRRMVDCMRAEARADPQQRPARTVVEAGIRSCDGDYWLIEP